MPWARKSISSGRLAVVLSALALFVALDGPATAGSLINGASLRPKSVPGSKLKDRSVTTAKLALNAVRSDRIRDGQVTGLDLADGTVGRTDLPADALAGLLRDIADGSITNPKLAAGAVTSDKIAADAVTSDKIPDGAVSKADIGSNTVDSDELTPASVRAEELTSAAVTSEKIAPDAVGHAALGNDSVRGRNVAASGVTTLNFPSLSTGQCNLQLVASPASATFGDDVLIVTPGASFSSNFVYSVKNEGTNTAYVKLCNVGAATLDMDGAFGSSWRWAAIDIL